MHPVPQIVIVGRPNVGKSSLLNLLAQRRVSIVEPSAGVTRDRVTVPVELANGQRVEITDTGGYGIQDAQDLTAHIERQIAIGLERAHLVLFVIDAQTGVVPLDKTVADVLRKTAGDKPIIPVANKVDAEHLEADGLEAARLGFGDPVMISATTSHNKQAMYDAIQSRINWSASHEVPEYTEGILLAVVGKRNAGKSTLVNSLADDDRVIVSPQAGTTRDAVDVRFEVDGQIFTAIDTAGLRRLRSLENDIEFYSHHRALRSVRRAHVCLLLIDATVPISQVDRQLAGEILRHHRPVVLVVNKWDLAEQDHNQQEYADYLDTALRGLNFAPIVFVSATQKQGLREVLGMARNLYDQANHRVQTATLNQVVDTIRGERGPSAKGGRRAKIYYAHQSGVDPPMIVLHVNQVDLFDHNYQSFLLNRFRDRLPYSEVPIDLVIRGRDRNAG